MAAACVLALPAFAQDPPGGVQFTLGRVVHRTPDKFGRIAIRSGCAEAHGCKVDYTIKHGSTLLGGIQALLLAGAVQTDYVTLSKRTAASLRRKRMRVTITAQASDPDGNQATFTKTVTLGPKKKTR